MYSSDNPPKTPWKDVSMEEMLAFLGLNIAMDVVNLPELDMYWSTKSIVGASLVSH